MRLKAGLFILIFQSLASINAQIIDDQILSPDVKTDSIAIYPNHFNEKIFVLDSTIGYQYDNNGWYRDLRKIALERNNYGELLSLIWKYRSGLSEENWQNRWLDVYSYYDDHQIMQQTRQVWSLKDKQWNTNLLELTSYSETGKFIEYMRRNSDYRRRSAPPT